MARDMKVTTTSNMRYVLLYTLVISYEDNILPLLQRSFKILLSTYTSICVCMAVLFSDLRTCLSCVFLFYIESGKQAAIHGVDTLVINVVTFDVVFSLSKFSLQ